MIGVCIIGADQSQLASYRLLLGTEHSIKILGEWSSISNSMLEISNLEPSVVILDVADNRELGIDWIWGISRSLPTAQIIITIAGSHAELIPRLLQLGTTSCLCQPVTRKQLIACIQASAVGLQCIHCVRTASESQTDAGHRPHSASRTVGALTEPQRKLLEKLAMGWSNKEIASMLGVTEACLGSRLKRLYAVLAVQNRTQAVLRFSGP